MAIHHNTGEPYKPRQLDITPRGHVVSEPKPRAQKTFATRSCLECQEDYEPSGPRQALCPGCRDKITTAAKDFVKTLPKEAPPMSPVKTVEEDLDESVDPMEEELAAEGLALNGETLEAMGQAEEAAYIDFLAGQHIDYPPDPEPEDTLIEPARVPYNMIPICQRPTEPPWDVPVDHTKPKKEEGLRASLNILLPATLSDQTTDNFWEIITVDDRYEIYQNILNDVKLMKVFSTDKLYRIR